MAQYTPEPCVEGAHYFDGMCYTISEELGNFVEAELACLPDTKVEAIYNSRLMWTTKGSHFEFMGRILERETGQTEYWVGADSRDYMWHWESR